MMDDSRVHPFVSQPSRVEPRRFVYRSVGRGGDARHPMRRSTDCLRPDWKGSAEDLGGESLIGICVYFRLY
jgi:hypothetical protein